MRTIFLLLFTALILFNCSDENVSKQVCSTPATLRDLSGLDGCGFVFELDDGKILIPLILGYCGTPPLSPAITEDPLYNFNWEDGKRVMIDYTIADMPNICMAGQVVKITCLSDYHIATDEQ